MLAVRAVCHGPDRSVVFFQGEQECPDNPVGVAEAVEVMPLPAAQIVRTILEEFPGAVDITGEPFALGQGDAVEVVEAIRLLLLLPYLPPGLFGLLPGCF